MKTLMAWAAPLALLAAPILAPVGVAAQEAEAAPELDLFAGLAQAFTVEPLTAEQQARLPRAAALVERIIPPGSLQEVMGSMFDSFLSPMATAFQPDPVTLLAQGLNIETYEITLTPEQAETAVALLDPAWRTRAEREAEALPALTGRMMSGMEPTIRTAMSELYAIHFTDSELADIDAFFATPSGTSYARKSLTMSSDPRLMATMMGEMPALFEAMASMEAEVAALTADLPPARGFADLSATERKGLASLLGMTVEDLEYRTSWDSGEYDYEDAAEY